MFQLFRSVKNIKKSQPARCLPTHHATTIGKGRLRDSENLQLMGEIFFSLLFMFFLPAHFTNKQFYIETNG